MCMFFELHRYEQKKKTMPSSSSSSSSLFLLIKQNIDVVVVLVIAEKTMSVLVFVRAQQGILNKDLF